MGTMSPKKVPETTFSEVLRYTRDKLSDDVAIVAVARSERGQQGPRGQTT
jgi:hypothetical protein